ncbi:MULTISPECIES: hypothetical protein [Ruminococcus]|uniref:hypothetical protein n=1 Tax=Ruminococcus TaxID=1263 RepID=UPI0025F51EF8|nr:MULTISPECIES: hypothetical protein [Ruminococcus]
MIIYDKRKPKTFDGANCIGSTGENLATTQEFLISGMNDITVDYYIHLRFADGSVNSVIPDSVTVDKSGTKIVWKVKKNDIFMHGYFELQLEGRGENGYVFQTQIVTLYADESIPIEDKEYLNPNSETLKLREEVQKNLDETKNQQSKIDENRKIIEQSNLSLKENISNKIEDRRQIVNQSENYPSIKYLETYYLPATMSYECDELDEMFAAKADKATTIDGYGITDAYTKATVKLLLAGKLDAMSFDNEPTLNSPCYLTSGTVYSALTKKFDNSNIETGKGNLAPAQAIYDGYEGSFNYSKIGKTVTVALNITTLIAGKNYVQFSGLPYTALTASRLSSIVAYTTANKLVNLRLDGSWLYISSPDTTFADGEKINAIITYIIG